VLAAQLGVIAAAAFQAVIALHVTALVVAIGCASAAGVRVGNAVGERAFGDIARRGWSAVAVTVAATAVFSVVFLLFPDASLQLFDEEGSPVLAIAKVMLLIVAPVILFDALQVVLVYALRAAGDPAFAALNQAISFLIIMVGVAWIAIHKYNLGATGLAIGLVVGIIFSASLMMARFIWITRHHGAWIAAKNK
jgi:multidrug resistance protein, MATE family